MCQITQELKIRSNRSDGEMIFLVQIVVSQSSGGRKRVSATICDTQHRLISASGVGHLGKCLIFQNESDHKHTVCAAKVYLDRKHTMEILDFNIIEAE